MKNRKFGYSPVEVLIAIAIIGLLAAIFVPPLLVRHGNLFRQGQLTVKPGAGIVYEVTAVDNKATTVIAIRHDEGYTNGTLGRVMLRVNENVCHVGTFFVRSVDGVDHVMAPFTNLQISGWVEKEDTTWAETNR